MASRIGIGTAIVLMAGAAATYLYAIWVLAQAFTALLVWAY